MNLFHRTSSGASIIPISGGFRFTIPESQFGQYRLAQLEDYAGLERNAFPSHPPVTLSLHARASSEILPGTWGFGFWNDPFPSLGFNGYPPRLPALPNAIWFFYASPMNYLSFREDKPAQGFVAQTFRSPRFHPSLLPAGLILPFSRRATHRILSRIIDEDAAIVSADATQWHNYRLEWSPNRSTFWVDESLVLDTPVSPRPPLGLVIWMDNQYAAFTPDGKLKWGLENNLTEAWLEIENIEIN